MLIDTTIVPESVRQNAGTGGFEDEGGLPLRTLQYRLRRLVEEGRLAREGERHWTKYRIPAAAAGQAVAAAHDVDAEELIPLSGESEAIRDYLRKPPEAPKPVSYNRDFLDSYRPGIS